ncbi:MAG: alpha/beta hydrolase [Cyanobacteria bacterium P01_A01_bin.123]
MTLSLHVEDAGDRAKPTIIFLHSAGASSRMWQTQMVHLTDFNCLAPDLPGHGQSSQTPWRSLDETAYLIAEVIQQRATHGRAHIVGVSLGAYVALQLLSRYPQVAERVILSGITAFPLPNRHPMIWMTQLMGPLMNSWLTTDFIIKLNVQAMKIPDCTFKRYHSELTHAVGNTMLDVLLEASRYKMPANINNIHHPTLITSGEHDFHLVHESLPVLANAMPQGEGYLVPDASHGWFFEMPDLFTQTVNAWCNANTLPAALIDVNELVFA